MPFFWKRLFCWLEPIVNVIWQFQIVNSYVSGRRWFAIVSPGLNLARDKLNAR